MSRPRPFRYPLDRVSLAEFAAPAGTLSPVVRDPQEGTVYAANGYIALRLTRGPVLHDDTIPEAGPDYLTRVRSLPWHEVTRPAGPGTWVSMTYYESRIWELGPVPLWQDKGWSRLACYLDGKGDFPVACLQLIARLPRAEIRMPAENYTAAIRFSGGEGLMITPRTWQGATGEAVPAVHLWLKPPMPPRPTFRIET